MGLRYVYRVMMLCFGVVFSQDDIAPITDTDTSLSLPQAPQPIQKSRAMQAQESYRNYLKILEHDGTYFLFHHSFTPIKDSLRPFLEQNELKFQLSAKLPLWRGAFWSKGTLFFGYTQTMWFQWFNFKYSSPVRDTDYKPSIFYSYPASWESLGDSSLELRLGLLHYSNGIGGEECYRQSFSTPVPENCLSRSAANRIMLEGIWEAGGVARGLGVHIKAWPFISERKDTPQLHRYMGYGSLRLYYVNGRHKSEVDFTPIFADFGKYYPSVRVGYSLGINDFVALYVQYFYGYGDNLYEYRVRSHRLGIGLKARSW